jgi:spore germination protein
MKRSQIKEDLLFSRLDRNGQKIEDVFSACADIRKEYYRFGPSLRHRALTVYCQTLVKEETFSHIKHLMQDLNTHQVGMATEIELEQIKRFFGQRGVAFKSYKLLERFADVVDKVLCGYVVLFFDSWKVAVGFEALNVESRSISEPVSEEVITGPHVGTTEDLRKNIGLIRSRLKNPALKIETIQTGGETDTEVAYLYLEGSVDQEVLAEFKRRIKRIEGKEILETSYIEELIEDSTFSPFPQHRQTERPDVAVASLLDGKIVVTVHGTGTLLICPAQLTDLFQSAEDYYQRTIIASSVRLLRMFALITSLTLPSIYIALVTFHPEIIPTVLLIAILETREGIPFPTVIEALIMIFFFELMREAGIRLPRPIGQAVSIVGALIIGEAAIRANIASPIMVVVVALTGISSFAVPQYDLSTSYRILQFPLMLMAGVMGGFGIMIMLILILLHLTSLRSLGQPYFSSLAPFRFHEWRDIFVRAPHSILLRSPRNKHLHRMMKDLREIGRE